MALMSRCITRRSLILLSVLLLSGFIVVGCDDDNGDGGDDQTVDRQMRTKASEAEALVQLMSDGARTYFEGDQMWSQADLMEPWHVADSEVQGRQLGMPVFFDDKVFPGGPDITVVSSQEVPADGESVTAEPHIEGDVDFDAEDVLRTLNAVFPDSMFVRITYETGPGTGTDATATITAEANFNADTSEMHRVIKELSVDDDYGAIASTLETENEYQ